MSTSSARSEPRMTVGEFLVWRESLADEEARYELVAGVPVRLMAPTTIRHAQIIHNISAALRGAIAEADLPCRVYDSGPGVAAGERSDECRIPDVVVTCSSAIDDTTHLVPEPLIMVEVASPSTRLTDINDKVEFYAGIPSIRHYVVIEQDRRRVLYHRRGPTGALEPRIIRAGEISLDPPGIRLAVETLYRETALAES